MKIFKNEGIWSTKINFVDNNNVFVGYDIAQQCCENAGWFISEKEEVNILENSVPEVENYCFDVDYFVKVVDEKCDELDEGKMVRFRLTDGKNELFLHLYNCHNGYYSHGFEIKNNDNLLFDGYL